MEPSNKAEEETTMIALTNFSLTRLVNAFVSWLQLRYTRKLERYADSHRAYG
jgi:hypothetical protein